MHDLHFLVVAAWFVGVLLVVNVIAVRGLRLVRRWRFEAREKQADVLGHAAGITGVINAVLFAFIVVVAWTYYDHAREAFSEEAGLVWQLWHDVESAKGSGSMYGMLPHPLLTKISTHLESYVKYVAYSEESVRTLYEKASSDSLRDLYKTIGEDELRAAYEGLLMTKRDSAHKSSAALRPLIDEMVHRFNDLFDARRRRFEFEGAKAVPGTVWVALVGGGLLCIACCWFLGIQDARLHGWVMFLIGSSFGLITFLIVALNTPFKGIDPIPNPYVTLLDDISGWEHREGEGEAAEHRTADVIGAPIAVATVAGVVVATMAVVRGRRKKHIAD